MPASGDASKVRMQTCSQNDLDCDDDPTTYCGAKDSDLSGNPSKMKSNHNNYSQIEKESAEALRERLSCIICMNDIRCMMI